MDLSAIGALLADHSRATLLAALLDGRSRTVSELARHAGVAVSTASEHLARLLDAGLVAVEAQGRHRYYRLAGAEVANALETLHALEPSVVAAPRAPAALAFARCCYDHLAGTLGVAMYEYLIDERDEGVHLRDPSALTSMGVHADHAPPARPRLRPCLDWTERRHHLAGTVGAALLDRLLDLRWLVRSPSPRVLRITDTGRRGLRDDLGMTVPG